MKMKKIFILGGLLMSGALVSGCSDFLEVKKYGASTVWETQGDIDKAIAALYSFTTNDSEGVTGRGIMWFECCSDNLTVGRPQSEAEDIRNFRMAPSNGRDVKNNWKIMYEVNAKANNIIKMVPTMNLDEAYKRKATGIAYFFRGFAMLWIAPYYGDNGPNGGIPIILDTTEPADMDMVRWGDAKEVYAEPTRRVNSHWDSATQTVVIDEPSDYDQGRTFDPVINQVFPIPVTAFNGTVNLKQNIGY